MDQVPYLYFCAYKFRYSATLQLFLWHDFYNMISKVKHKLYILIFCWPCISIYLFLNINKLDALNFIISLFQASTCFEHMCSKHVEAWNKLIIKFSASNWLILRNKYIIYCVMVTPFKNSGIAPARPYVRIQYLFMDTMWTNNNCILI